MEVARPVRRAGWRNPSLQDDRALQSDPYTYIPTLAGFLYLAIVLDVFSRRLHLAGPGEKSACWGKGLMRGADIGE